jgi:hypothetical protein
MSCGNNGHVFKNYKAAPKCMLYKELKRQSDHYLGSGGSEAYRRSKMGKKKLNY